MKVKVVKNILEVNDRMADANRRILAKAGVFAVNLMSAPGAGKTTLLERTIRSLGERISFGVIEGDIQGTHDAEVIAALDVPVVQINTEGACHLDANMISAILPQLPLDDLDVLVVENERGRGIIGVIDGIRSKGIEGPEGEAWRKDFLRQIGYKL